MNEPNEYQRDNNIDFEDDIESHKRNHDAVASI